MATKLTQALARQLSDTSKPGTIIYDAEVSGLRMVIGRKSSSWKLVGRINDGSGLYVTLTIGRVEEMSIKTARQKAIELRQALARGEDPRRPKAKVPTVQEALDRYIEGNRDNLAASTLADYRRHVERPLKSLLKLPMDKIDRGICRNMHEKLTKTRGPYAANTALRMLRLLYNDVLRDHDLPPNPVSLAVRFNKEEARNWAISAEEMPRLWRHLDALDDPIARGCWLLMLFTGLRSSNARAARWDWLYADGVLTVPKTKAGRVFPCPLPRYVIQELEALRDHTRPLASPFIFPATTTRTGHVSVLRSDRGFPYQPHALRHNYRTWCLEAGIDFQTVTYLMDHSAPHVSFRYVTRAHLTGHLREAQERVAARLLSFRGAR